MFSALYKVCFTTGNVVFEWFEPELSGDVEHDHRSIFFEQFYERFCFVFVL